MDPEVYGSAISYAAVARRLASDLTFSSGIGTGIDVSSRLSQQDLSRIARIKLGTHQSTPLNPHHLHSLLPYFCSVCRLRYQISGILPSKPRGPLLVVSRRRAKSQPTVEDGRQISGELSGKRLASDYYLGLFAFSSCCSSSSPSQALGSATSRSCSLESLLPCETSSSTSSSYSCSSSSSYTSASSNCTSPLSVTDSMDDETWEPRESKGAVAFKIPGKGPSNVRNLTNRNSSSRLLNYPFPRLWENDDDSINFSEYALIHF
ncbi:unnamed protein product [Protopolystoma xenopodis]|uniref:Uncharacterized protein n=1 Tax=Protopolystoma xenopodis TaxID=117903 RepID=A0A3S5A5B5_9PLAT|nr:unnamed protein product [Protopolystoma xenopodis]